jgi:predicted transcriptional regulator
MEDDPLGFAGCGTLEIELITLLGARKEARVRDIAPLLSRRLTSHTVSRTLDGLFKRGHLHRRKRANVFFYSRDHSECANAAELIGRLAGGSAASRSSMISELVDAITLHDPALLDHLQRRIQKNRLQATVD